MTDWVAIAGEGLSAAINPHGAELSSLTDCDGREYLTDANPAYWTGRAPVLFPIVGGLAGDTYRLGDAAYAMPKHGFARRSRFDLLDRGANHATFRLVESEETRAAYPFAFTLDMAFRIDGLTLATAATVTNRGDAPMPFSFGYHPAFAWPLPGGGAKLGHTITFAEAEPQPVRRLDAAGLLAGSVPTPVKGRELALSPDLFEADALIWDHLASRALTYSGPGGTALDITFPDSPMLGIWQKPGAAFLCIEPWNGVADPAGFTGDFADKPGIMLLPPGARRRLSMDVTVRRG